MVKTVKADMHHLHFQKNILSKRFQKGNYQFSILKLIQKDFLSKKKKVKKQLNHQELKLNLKLKNQI